MSSFYILNTPEELIYRICSFLREEDLAVLEVACKSLYTYVEKDSRWESSLKEKVISPIQSSAKGQLATLYRRYCRYFGKQFPSSSKKNNVFTQKMNVDDLIGKLAEERLQPIFEKVVKSHPQLLPLCVQARPQASAEDWNCYALTLTLQHRHSDATFYINLLTEKPRELALHTAVQYSPSHVPLLLEKGALPTKSTLDCAVKHAPSLVPLLLAKGADPDVDTLFSVNQRCPEHSPLIVRRLQKLNTPQQTIDENLFASAYIKTIKCPII